jgi:hypothetical protein
MQKDFLFFKTLFWDPIVGSCFRILEEYVKYFSKTLPYKLQDYNVWSEGISLFASCQTGTTNFELSLYFLFITQSWVFDLIIENWVDNPQKKPKTF